MALKLPSKPREPIPSDPIWRLTVAQYQRMVAEGILSEDDPVELLEGWLVAKMPKSPRHSLITQLTHDAILSMLPEQCFINVQEPITTVDSEPEPDLTVIRGARRDYAARHPSAEDTLLVIEVADATLQRDRGLKLRIYAAAGVQNYWIINLPESQIEVFTQPSAQDGTYRSQAVYKLTDSVPVILNGQTVGTLTVRDLLG